MCIRDRLLEGDVGKLKTDQAEFVTNIAQSTKRMIDLVGSLLNISRLESGRIIVNPQPTNLAQLISVVVEDLHTDLKSRHQKLTIDIDPTLPSINLDERMVSQVYMNLLTNAIRYSPNGGEISVKVRRDGDDILSEVKDSGYGIPADEQKKIFERFFRASNVMKIETDGTGLGLYLIKIIVDSSGGRVWFKSTEGKGTTFSFTLPVKGMEAHKGDVQLD